jgi:hypothetical protein
MSNNNKQVRYWMLTIPESVWVPPTVLPQGITYLKGQLECGETTGYSHYQVVVVFNRSVRLGHVKNIFGGSGVHAEPTRSEAANDYVWKDETCIPDTRFELGSLPKSSKYTKPDWDLIKSLAKEGNYEEIRSDIMIRHWGNLTRIHGHFSKPGPIVREVSVFWGATGTGKSKRAWEEATFDAYPKIPTTKFWDGYRGHKNVVIDEFTGKVGIEHMLQWLDRYPCLVEIKGSCVPLKTQKLWITSNINPSEWYNDTNSTLEQRLALRRRFNLIVEFKNFLA